MSDIDQIVDSDSNDAESGQSGDFSSGSDEQYSPDAPFSDEERENGGKQKKSTNMKRKKAEMLDSNEDGDSRVDDIGNKSKSKKKKLNEDGNIHGAVSERSFEDHLPEPKKWLVFLKFNVSFDEK